MSVLIKDMELPKDCPYCKMAYYNASDEFTGCAVVPNKRYAMHNDAVYAKSTQRPDWCPFIEIPKPHGRLIDADAYSEDLMDEAHMVWGLLKPETIERINRTVEDLKNYPAVIEAEGVRTNEKNYCSDRGRIY